MVTIKDRMQVGEVMTARPATVDEEEYSEEFMVRYRNQGKAPAEQEGGISGYEEEGEEDFDDYDSEDY